MIKTFKIEVARRYKNRCVLSKIHTCQKIHIIPRKFCRRHPEFNQLHYEPNNGLLLNPTLHTEYDAFLWTLDIYRAEFDHDRGEVQLPIIIFADHQRKSYEIGDHSDKLMKVKIESIPYLWVNYQVFLTKHYSPSTNLDEEYNYFLNSMAFHEIQNEPSLALEQISNFEYSPSLIIRSRNFGQEFLTIDRLKPFNHQVWLSIEKIAPELIEEYQSNLKDSIYEP